MIAGSAEQLEPAQKGAPVAVANLLLSVVIPAYNEEKRLGATLIRMLEYFDTKPYGFEILVIDDGSTDGTARVVDAVAETRPEVRLLQYDRNRGKGYAVRFGMLRATGDRVLFSDADLATPIEEVEKLLASLDASNDVAIGSRDIRGSELLQRESFLREFGGRAFNKLVQFLAVQGIHDTQCGFKLFTQGAAQKIFSRCQVDDFAFDVEVLYVATRILGLRVAEVPIRWAHQAGSKISPLRDGIRMVRTVFKIRISRYATAASPAGSTGR